MCKGDKRKAQECLFESVFRMGVTQVGDRSALTDDSMIRPRSTRPYMFLAAGILLLVTVAIAVAIILYATSRYTRRVWLV